MKLISVEYRVRYKYCPFINNTVKEITCIQYDENIVFHDNGSLFWAFWKPIGEVDDSEELGWHDSCNFKQEAYDEKKHANYLKKYQPVLEKTFDKCIFDGHDWGREFEFKGTPSRACKICKNIEPVS